MLFRPGIPSNQPLAVTLEAHQWADIVLLASEGVQSLARSGHGTTASALAHTAHTLNEALGLLSNHIMEAANHAQNNKTN